LMSSLGKRSLGDLSPGGPGSRGSASKERRLAFDTDEILLHNEQLTDKVRTLEDDLLRCKEKATRQLSFLEEENIKVRKTANDVKEKYYEEKKNWQRKLREAEAGATSEVSPKSTAPSIVTTTQFNGNNNNSSSTDWDQRLSALQALSQEKVRVCVSLSLSFSFSPSLSLLLSLSLSLSLSFSFSLLLSLQHIIHTYTKSLTNHPSNEILTHSPRNVLCSLQKMLPCN
jgi:hypothetical protein